MRMIVEQLVDWRSAGETEVVGENLPQRHFVHHKSHMTRPGLESRAAVVGNATLSITNPTSLDLGSNLGHRRLTAWAMARPQNILV
jgi:hypothetical protein